MGCGNKTGFNTKALNKLNFPHLKINLKTKIVPLIKIEEAISQATKMNLIPSWCKKNCGKCV